LDLERLLEVALGSESEPDEQQAVATVPAQRAVQGSPSRVPSISSGGTPPRAAMALSESFAAANTTQPGERGKRAMERLFSFDGWAMEPNQKVLLLETRQPSFADWQMAAAPLLDLQPHPQGSEFASPTKLSVGPSARHEEGLKRGVVATIQEEEGGPLKKKARRTKEDRPGDEMAAATQDQAGPSSVPGGVSASGRCALEQLPHAVIFRVLCCLSADALGLVGTTSQTLRAFSMDNTLWRRLYLGRWSKPDAKQLHSHRLRGARSWLGYYKDRDATEAREALQRIPAEMREVCHQMHVALRKTTLPLGACGGADDLVLADASEADKVVEWRRHNGKPDTVAFHRCVSGGQPAQCCKYVRVGEAMVCKSSGWAHFCDDTCSERIVTSSTGMMVCPISGRCFETLMTEAEEQAMRGGCGEVYDDDHYYEKGSLGRSFQAGYNCADEKDLERVCGVKFQ